MLWWDSIVAAHGTSALHAKIAKAVPLEALLAGVVEDEQLTSKSEEIRAAWRVATEVAKLCLQLPCDARSTTCAAPSCLSSLHSGSPPGRA
eukprot:1034590-Amphidinium_carterae.1